MGTTFRLDWYAIKSGPWIWGRALELTLPMSAAVRVTTDVSEAGGF
jgi:hypothetical protein